jgi:hypothetical protein
MEEDKAHQSEVFFIKDKIGEGEVRVTDCPTKEIWADMLTKPLQGMAFRKMRAKLMNCDVMYEEREENETSFGSGPLTGRGKPALPSQTLQSVLGGTGQMH